MKLHDYIDPALLEKYLCDGVVEQRFHNTLPLTIFCYGRKATYDNIWDDVTCKTRGLIVGPNGEVVARPFEKFFNIDTASRPETERSKLIHEPFTPFIQDKLDGSMGTYWEYEGQFGIATKGSFHSEQAEWATAWINEHYRKDWGVVRYWMHPWTPVFEIINQSIQHHVCHYEPKDDNKLVLIGMVNRESGEELHGAVLEHQGNLNGIAVATYYKLGPADNMQILESLLTSQRRGKEGFVASWARSGAPSLKVKIKHEDFLRLQKIAHHTTPKVVFDYVRAGNFAEINEVIRLASPWLSSQVKEWVTAYQDRYDLISSDARYVVTMAQVDCTTRKEYAHYFLEADNGAYKHLSAVCFNILDERDYKSTVWDLVEPLVKRQKFSEVEAEG